MLKLMITLSLCIIVKDEERYIENCITSVQDIVDEIVVVDTGSTDSTVKIAEKLNAKIFSYEWDDNFSNARNFALEQATCDWILVLDADETVHNEDVQLIKDKIQSTNSNAITNVFYNFTGEVLNPDNFVINVGFRIFKRNMFHYTGIIHERLIPTENNKIIEEHGGIRILHYGYLKDVAIQKDKRNRNIPLIEKMLEQNPDSGIDLFYIGDEYFMDEDYDIALDYYEESREVNEVNAPYYPLLLYRTALCQNHLNRTDDALKTLRETLEQYPKFTDIEFLRGKIYQNTRRYTLAIDSFNACINMGVPPKELNFIPDTDLIRPLTNLGEIYYTLEDWARAEECYTRLIKNDKKRVDLIYKMGEILNNRYKDKTQMCKMLEKLLIGRNPVVKRVLIIEVLLNLGIHDKASEYLSKIEHVEEIAENITYFRGRIYFYSKNYQESYKIFKEVIATPPKRSALINNWNRSLEFAVICCMVSNENFEEMYTLVDSLQQSPTKSVLTYFLKGIVYKSDVASNKIAINMINEILKVSEIELFKKLNLPDGKGLMLELAKVCYQNNYKTLSVNLITHCVAEFSQLDADTINILAKEF